VYYIYAFVCVLDIKLVGENISKNFFPCDLDQWFSTFCGRGPTDDLLSRTMDHLGYNTLKI